MGLLDVTGIGSIADFAGKVIDKIFPDKTAAEAAKLELFKLQQQGAMQELQNEFQLAMQQGATNIEEAKNGSKFVSGWRPAVGWCVHLLLHIITSSCLLLCGQRPVSIQTHLKCQALI
jgi:hypothetical protein